MCLELAQAVEFVWQRDRFVGRVHVKKPLCTFCLRSQPGALADFTTEAFFFFAPGRQEHSEAHPNLLHNDNDGFASELRP